MWRGLATAPALVGLALLPAGQAASPPAGAAATCADYENQADAQRAADTRDADGDGIYCESLPCPCLRPGQEGEGGGESPRPRRRARRRAQVLAARVTSVVDGDTLKVRASGARRRRYTVRLIGIDTPETRRPGTAVECGGPEASDSLKRLAPAGTRVRLTTDPTQDTYDRYDRLLAYVETRSGRQLNVTQVANGWAEVYVFRRAFRQLRRFRAAERRARSARRGVWGACGGDFHSESSSSSSASLASGVPASYGAR